MMENEQTKDQLIAALRQRVAELEATEQQYFSLFEHAGDSIYIADPVTFDIIDANSPAARRLGYTRDELLRLNLDDIELLPQEDETHMLSAWESSFSGSRTYECHYRRKGGSLIPVEVRSRIVDVGDRQILQNAVRDITKRKGAEIALREANERLSLLQQIDVELVQKLDVHYVCTRALEAAMRLSSAEAGVIGLVEGDKILVVHALGGYSARVGTFLPQDRGIVGRVIRQQQPELVMDVSADPNYEPTIPETRAQMSLPLLSRQRFTGILSLETTHAERFGTGIFDFVKLLATRTAVAIDNANSYEEQVKLVEELDAFAHTVAHDLKSPLSIMLGYTWMLVEKFEQMPVEQSRVFLKTLAKSGEKMNNIINELLLLASVRKLDEIKTAPLDMGLAVREALGRLTLMIEEYQAEVVMPDSWPTASGYASWVEEVWANYISNAIKYGGTPPVIEVGATLLEEHSVRYWVKDNGAGLDADQQARLFNQFTRLDEKRARGHGLGLSIVQRIVDKLGGQVGVESEIGVGSVFSFTLPAPEERSH